MYNIWIGLTSAKLAPNTSTNSTTSSLSGHFLTTASTRARSRTRRDRWVASLHCSVMRVVARMLTAAMAKHRPISRTDPQSKPTPSLKMSWHATPALIKHRCTKVTTRYPELYLRQSPRKNSGPRARLMAQKPVTPSALTMTMGTSSKPCSRRQLWVSAWAKLDNRLLHISSLLLASQIGNVLYRKKSNAITKNPMKRDTSKTTSAGVVPNGYPVARKEHIGCIKLATKPMITLLENPLIGDAWNALSTKKYAAAEARNRPSRTSASIASRSPRPRCFWTSPYVDPLRSLGVGRPGPHLKSQLALLVLTSSASSMETSASLTTSQTRRAGSTPTWKLWSASTSTTPALSPAAHRACSKSKARVPVALKCRAVPRIRAQYPPSSQDDELAMTRSWARGR
mmetsp:Transcript_58491/g.135032  ORF Transcript_58491/g.135032 Transcript_58491/m.135032 type:complete len:398 (-) Transcript_58491:459-1652(-)